MTGAPLVYQGPGKMALNDPAKAINDLLDICDSEYDLQETIEKEPRD